MDQLDVEERLDAALSGAAAVMERATAPGRLAGAVAAVLLDGKPVMHKAWGYARKTPEKRAMTLNTLFDIASLTKPVATTAAFLKLVEEGVISLDAGVASVLPEFDRPGKRAISFRHLLTHTSGLPGWRPTYVFARGVEQAVRYIADEPLAYAPGTDVHYSDPGFMVLGAAIAKLADMPLDRFVTQAVFRPAGLSRTGYGPVDGDVAATEAGNRYEADMVARSGLAFDRWRTDVICGEVHDGNAYYTLDGISGNAGVFSTAMDLARYGHMLLRGGLSENGRVFAENTVSLMFRDHTGHLPVGRGLGWKLHRSGLVPPAEWQVPSSSRVYFPPEMYGEACAPNPEGELFPHGSPGHTGFTGTSLWLERDRRLSVALLTNRVHPHIEPDSLHWRPLFHNALLASLDKPG